MMRAPTEQMPARARRAASTLAAAAAPLASLSAHRFAQVTAAMPLVALAELLLLSHPGSRCEQKPATRGVHGVHAVDHGQDVHDKGPTRGRQGPSCHRGRLRILRRLRIYDGGAVASVSTRTESSDSGWP